MRLHKASGRFLQATSAAVLGLTAALAYAGTDLTETAERTAAARILLMQESATAADVDRFLALTTDDLVYEDPVVKMRIQGKDQIRNGLTAFLGASRNARGVVTKRIAAANVVVLQQTVSFDEKQDDGRWKPRQREQVTVLEFEGSKVRRIADYWAR